MIDLQSQHQFTSLVGKFLVASPYSQLNDMFNKSIIYVISHSPKGVIGVIINRLLNQVPFNRIMEIISPNNTNAANAKDQFYLHMGGPVETDKGLVLRISDNDHCQDLTQDIENREFSFTSESLKDVVLNDKSQKSLFIMGYTIWEVGQLEKELQKNFWLITNSNADIIFMKDDDLKWQAAIDSLGTRHAIFTGQVGHG
jgi:putative transcriptional regulator